MVDVRALGTPQRCPCKASITKVQMPLSCQVVPEKPLAQPQLQEKPPYLGHGHGCDCSYARGRGMVLHPQEQR